jgi:hypothetical protein
MFITCHLKVLTCANARVDGLVSSKSTNRVAKKRVLALWIQVDGLVSTNLKNLEVAAAHARHEDVILPRAAVRR